MPAAARAMPLGLVVLTAFVAVTLALLVLFAPNRRAEAAGGLALTAALPEAVPKGTVLTVGDPVTQWVVQHNGWDTGLPFTIKWVQITGGPDVTEAFHARALDVGFGANVPPIHATWVGLPVKIVAAAYRRDPLDHPAFVLGIAPGAHIRSIADLRGKRIAISPSQVQGQIVLQTLKAAGLTKRDVTLVELPSSIGGDVYTNALASNAVDMAPIGGGIVAERYLRKFGADGATVLHHPDFRDDPVFAYVPVEVLRDPAKAAALKAFVVLWGRAQAWKLAHPEELARGYYVGEQGLKLADARLIVAAAGKPDIPAGWAHAIRYEQTAIDLLAPELGHARFESATLFDPRFETLAARGFEAAGQHASTPPTP
ncbi:MAG TPA: ABC transporter substrate-binding protein [Sphingomonas sp.]|nr:ABC transporter substrate-binding protein [Sphingomonas sp.]